MSVLILLSFIFPQRYVNWCIKNKKETKWEKATLQEWDEKATLISKGKITFFSKLQYHVTVNDNDVHFLCEISKSPNCGTGFTSIQTSIHIEKEKGNTIEHIIRTNCFICGHFLIDDLLSSVLISKNLKYVRLKIYAFIQILFLL